MSEILDSLWVDKYRPKQLDQLVLPNKYMVDFQRIIEKQSLPNLLLSGPPGGGKTTIALLLCSKHGVLHNKQDNLLMANGSVRKTRSIKFVEDVIEPFLKTPPVGDKYKIVFIDEADNLTPDSYDSWRGVIEKYQKAYGRFIWTGNYLSSIPEAIQSRFTPYVFERIPKEFILNYSKSILKAEGISHDDKSLKFVINNLYPDVRRIVNILERNSWDGKLDVSEDDVITTEKIIISKVVEIISLIEKAEDKKIGNVINGLVEILSGKHLEYRNVYIELFFMKKIPAPAKILINKYSNEHQGCLIPHMHFMGMVFNIIKSLQEYRRMVGFK